ncbi:nucleotide exchange factor GrpE [Allohahella marinimesophila]|uniref:Protein GrpE n=1 Tax=Allohahella marinimesophila TaxID=1054972 RepID=A0ABP7Q1H8_9GAMM
MAIDENSGRQSDEQSEEQSMQADKHDQSHQGDQEDALHADTDHAGDYEEEALSATDSEADDASRADQSGAVDIAALLGNTAELNKRLADQHEQMLRIQAEMQNVQRRADSDVERARKFALERFVKELLPVVDSLEKALEAEPGDSQSEAVMREGVEMTLGLLVNALKKFDVEPINPVGSPFNPELHEAMSMVANPDMAPNSVMAVLQKGYTLSGRLLRPAMVIVAKAP